MPARPETHRLERPERRRGDLPERLAGTAAAAPGEPSAAPAWHALGAGEVLERLQSRSEGLTPEEAARRLAAYGPNRLRPPERRPALLRFLVQFHNVLIYVLLGAAGVTALLAHWVDTGVILGVVVINALIGFIQEGKAERALDAIRRILSHEALVRRGGHQHMVPAERLVPGDIVHLQAGDKVPADLRLLQVKSLRVDEAMLTGESVPVEKHTAPVPEAAPVGDRRDMAYSGTFVSAGQATGMVCATGDATEIGRISRLLGEVQTLTTPLLRQMARFARWLTAAILAVAALTSLFGVMVQGYAAAEMFLAAVGLAVAAIPEGLPAIMTITLAIGVQRMARQNAIIRRLPAAEALGSVTLVCSDKTGTLTRNEMTVRALATAAGTYQVTGGGYDPHGAFRLDERELEPDAVPVLAEVARVALLCNDSEVHLSEDAWRLTGDPTEGALYTLALKAGLEPRYEREALPRTDVIPFASEHRFMATLHHDHAGHAAVYLKGAPERVLELCAAERGPGGDAPIEPERWHARLDELAAAGLRLIALAAKSVPGEQRELRFDDVQGGFTLLAVAGITDPPREEAIAAVRACREAGIGVKMITGDHAATATAIGRQMGIGGAERPALTGPQLDAMDETTLRRALADTDIFARVSPEHKLRLVEAAQAGGEVTAMTGDGVNDAPALKRADIGVAMGVKGTEVAKEAAEMVLADDNFASIAAAIKEGRTVYDNIKKSILFILPTNGGEAFTLVAAIAMGTMLPITPVQILWINMITAVTLALSLAFEPPEAGVMGRPPRDPNEPLLSGFLVWRVAFVSALLVAGVFGLFVWNRAGGMSIDAARTVAVNTLVMFEIFYLFNTRYIHTAVLSAQGLLGNRYALLAVAAVLVFQLLFTYAPPMQALFATEALPAAAWGPVVAVALSVFVLVEAEKAIVRRIRRHRAVS